MESGSKAANLEFQLFDFNDVELMDHNGHVMVGKYQQNETAGDFLKGILEIGGSPCGSNPPLINQPSSKHMFPGPASGHNYNELHESPSENNGRNLAPSRKSPSDPTFTEASHQMPKTAEDVHVALQSPLTRDDQLQPNQINANPDPFGCGNVTHNNSNPLHVSAPQLVHRTDRNKVIEQVEFVSSPGRTNGSFLHGASSHPNLRQLMYSGFEGNDSSLGHDAIDAHQTTPSIFSPLIMEPTHSFPWALAEKIPQNGSYSAQSLYTEHEFNSSVQENQLNAHIGSSLQSELQGPQRVESVNRGKGILFADQFEQNSGNNISNDNNQQELPYSSWFPQSPSGFGFLHGGSTQINQQAPLWVSNKENDIYRPLAPSGSQVNQFKATSNSDSHCHKFMLPISSATLRPQQLNNPLQLLNQVPSTPNGSDSLLQHSVLTKHSMPFEFMPQQFPYQHGQVSTALGAYNSQNCSSSLPESSMPLRTPILPSPHQINPLDVSDLQYRNSLQSKPPLLSSGGFFQDLSNLQRIQFDQPNLITKLFGTQCSTSLLQESLLHSGSYQLPGHQQQASSQFSMKPSLPNSKHHNSNLAESSVLPRLPTVQQGLLNQTARPFASYPSSGTSMSSIVLNSLLQPETGDTSAPHQLETSRSSHKEQGTSRRRRGHTRTRFEMGESSSFKRLRRESSMPQASSAEQVNNTFLSLQNAASSSSNTASLSYPRQIKNSVYDPIFEGIGLPIDPHLRLFASSN